MELIAILIGVVGALVGVVGIVVAARVETRVVPRGEQKRTAAGRLAERCEALRLAVTKSVGDEGAALQTATRELEAELNKDRAHLPTPVLERAEALMVIAGDALRLNADHRWGLKSPWAIVVISAATEVGSAAEAVRDGRRVVPSRLPSATEVGRLVSEGVHRQIGAQPLWDEIQRRSLARARATDRWLIVMVAGAAVWGLSLGWLINEWT